MEQVCLTLGLDWEEDDVVIIPLSQVLQLEVLLLGGRMCDLVASCCRTARLASCNRAARCLWETHTLQISYELGVGVLVVDILPDGQEAIASSAESLRNRRQEQQQAGEDELHLEEQTTQMQACRIKNKGKRKNKSRRQQQLLASHVEAAAIR